jgi:predicted Zn-dependent peptidase
MKINEAYSITKLNNGLTVIFVNNPNFYLTTGMIIVHTGSINESKDINGISHFLEHLVFKGTEKFPTSKDLITILEANGINYNAFTSYEYTGYHLTCMNTNINTVINMLSQFFYEPIFNSKDIEPERGVIISEMNMNNSDNSRKVYNNLVKSMFPNLFDIIGTESTIKSLKKDDFENYHTKYYIPANSLLIISGNLEHLDTELLKQAFDKNLIKKNYPKQLKQSQQLKEIGTKRIIVEKTDDSQSQIMIGFRTPGRDKDYIKMEVLLTLLARGFSSKLMRLLRDKNGWSYFVNSSQSIFEKYGFITIHFNCENQFVYKAVYQAIKQLVDFDITETELNIAKNYLTGKLAEDFQNSLDFALNYGLEYLLNNKINTFDDLRTNINNVTIDDLKEKKKYLTVGNCWVSIIGDPDADKTEYTLLESLLH